MPSYRVAEYFDEKAMIFDQSDRLVMAEDGDAVIGLAAGATLATPWGSALNFLTLLVAERWHGSAVTSSLLHGLFSCWFDDGPSAPSMIVSKTYSARTLSMIRGFARWGCVVAPGEGPARSLEDRLCWFANTFHPDSGFDPRTGIITKAAGPHSSRFYSDRPRSARTRIDQELAGVPQSDRLLSLIHFPNQESSRRMMRSLSRANCRFKTVCKEN